MKAWLENIPEDWLKKIESPGAGDSGNMTNQYSLGQDNLDQDHLDEDIQEQDHLDEDIQEQDHLDEDIQDHDHLDEDILGQDPELMKQELDQDTPAVTEVATEKESGDCIYPNTVEILTEVLKEEEGPALDRLEPTVEISENHQKILGIYIHN